MIIDGKVYEGRNRNAGAIGSMPVGDGDHSGQLIRLASLFTLERELAAAGYNAERMWDRTSDWSDLGPALDNWLDRAANGIARAIASAASVVDFQAAVIDGSMPAPVRAPPHPNDPAPVRSDRSPGPFRAFHRGGVRSAGAPEPSVPPACRCLSASPWIRTRSLAKTGRQPSRHFRPLASPGRQNQKAGSASHISSA